MRYWIEPRDRIDVKASRFLSFAKNMGKNLSNKYGQKLLDSAKKSSRKSSTELHSKKLENNNTDDELKVPKKRYISPEKKAANDWWINVSITI